MRKQSLGAFRWGRGGGTDAVLGPGHAFPTQCVNVLRSQAEFFLGLETEWSLRCCLPLVMAETVSLDRGCGGRGPSGKKPWTWSPPAAPAAPFLSSCHLLSSQLFSSSQKETLYSLNSNAPSSLYHHPNPMNLTTLSCHISGIIQSLFFCEWLISLSINIFSSFFYCF